MKTKTLAISFFLFLLAFSQQVRAQLGFAIANNTGSTIIGVYASPSDNDGWGRNLLNGRIRPGNTESFVLDEHFPRPYDIRIVYSGSKDDGTFYKHDLWNQPLLFLSDNARGGTHLQYMSFAEAAALLGAAGGGMPSVQPQMPVFPAMGGGFPAMGGGFPAMGGGFPSFPDNTGSRICPSCHGTGSCPICHGTGTSRMYGTSSPCDPKCSACGGTGRY